MKTFIRGIVLAMALGMASLSSHAAVSVAIDAAAANNAERMGPR